jgi:hypothetical protein
MHVENVGNEIGDDGRAGASLRQFVTVTSDLRQHRRDVVLQAEMFIADEIAADSPKVDGRKEILEIKVEHPSPVSMLRGVGDDRTIPPETMRDIVLSLLFSVYLIKAILEQDGEFQLKEFQFFVWSLNQARSSAAPGNLEGAVSGRDWFGIEDGGQSLQCGSQKVRDIAS